MFFNLQNHPTFHSEERLVNLVRGRECFVGLSILLVFAGKVCSIALKQIFFFHHVILLFQDDEAADENFDYGTRGEGGAAPVHDDNTDGEEDDGEGDDDEEEAGGQTQELPPLFLQ